MSAVLEPPAVPAGLHQQRPVPWAPVEGDREGLMAWVEYAAYRALVTPLVHLPDRQRRGACTLLARVARRLDPAHSAAARKLIQLAFGATLERTRREELVLSGWRHLFEVVLSTERLYQQVDPDHLERHFELDLCPDAQRLLDSGRGAVFATPHLGQWDAATAVLPRVGFDPLYLIVRPQRNRILSRYFQRQRERCGAWLLARHGALKNAQEVLRAGGFVAMATDQRARIGPVVVPFFGRPAQTEQSPALLMKRCRVPIVVGACLFTAPERFRVTLPKVLWPEENVGVSVEEITRRLNAAMEVLILRQPEQYLWIHDRYRGAPAETAEWPAAAVPAGLEQPPASPSRAQ